MIDDLSQVQSLVGKPKLFILQLCRCEFNVHVGFLN